MLKWSTSRDGHEEAISAPNPSIIPRSELKRVSKKKGTETECGRES